MARPYGYKRLTRKARHLIHHLRRTKHASVQDQMIHELRHEVSRTHGFRGPKKAPERSGAGHWRPLTRKAKQILTRLRSARVWSVQKQLVTELARELENGRRRVDRVRQSAARGRDHVKAGRNRVKAGAKRTRKAGTRFRGHVKNGQEKLLARAERKQGEREKRGPGKRTRLRRSVRDNASRLRRRLRASWRYRHAGRARRRFRTRRLSGRTGRAPSPMRPSPARMQYRAPRTPRASLPVRAPRVRIRRPARTR